MRRMMQIEAAKEGGFVALGSDDYGDRRPLLFAGTLPEVLEFARASFADTKPQGEGSSDGAD